MSKARIMMGSVACVALGALLGANFVPPARAQTAASAAYRECYFMKVWTANGGTVAEKLAAVPPGWTVVGVGGQASVPATAGVVLCR